MFQTLTEQLDNPRKPEQWPLKWSHVLLGGISESDSAYCGTLPWHGLSDMSVCMSSVTLVHPAEAVGWNEMPFCRNTCAVPSTGTTVLHTT